jgi:DNA repair protein RecN (Recombination protein N)
MAALRAEVERAQREADFLRHAVDELQRLAPEASEETALAERRTAMMQARRWRATCAMRMRRWQARHRPCRRFPLRCAGWSAVASQAPSLIEPAVKGARRRT